MSKTLEQGFNTFISRLIPLGTEHDKAASHKDSVFGCLESNHNCKNMFEIGSFGAGTGVRHYSDSDYFTVFPTEDLKQNSSGSLRLIKESLQRTFPRTEGIAVTTPAIKIPFGEYASETMEITPCDKFGTIQTIFGKFNQYQIADGEGGLKNSSPSAHNAYVNHHNNRLNGKLKPLIQLVKAWKYYNSVPISSFYLELRTTKYAETQNTIIYDTDLYNIIKFFAIEKLPAINDPLGITGRIVACNSDTQRETSLNKVHADFLRAEDAFKFRESDLDKCFDRWNIFFNHKFPAR